ncbi:MAG: hypothetical protein H6842_09575 [Rhodospirillaceae bacterium]|nr:hypothetical protein [Rhodospirillaceae bacterium]
MRADRTAVSHAPSPSAAATLPGSAVADTAPAVRAFSRAALACALFAGVGWLILTAWPQLQALVGFHLFVQHDTAWLLGAAVVLALALPAGRLLARRTWPVGLPTSRTVLGAPVIALVGAVVVVAAAGSWLVFAGHPLAMDEFMALFQARALQGGALIPALPADWADFAEALQPIFLRHDPTLGVWSPDYRPGNAAIVALFGAVHLAPLAEPLMAGASVALVAWLARRTWPEERHLPIIAAALLAASPQLLVTAMTPYSMTAHLFFNLAWVVLHVRDDRAGHAGALAVGFLAIGLHQVHVHPAFILPFMLSLLWRRRVWLAALYASAYAAFLLFWLFWRDIAMALEGLPHSVGVGDGGYLAEGLLRRLRSHSLADIHMWLGNLGRFVAWQNLALLPLAVAGLAQLRRAPWLVRMLAWGCLTSLLPYLLLMPYQGHGWGYRYLHVCLGSFALIAAYGWVALKRDLAPASARRTAAALVAAAAIGVVVGVPLRAVQAHRFAHPFAEAQAYVERLPVDAVLIDTAAIWYGTDLVRNDPFLRNTPKLMAVGQLTDGQLETLCRDRDVAFVGLADLSALGLRPNPHVGGTAGAATQARPVADRLAAAGCTPVLSGRGHDARRRAQS